MSKRTLRRLRSTAGLLVVMTAVLAVGACGGRSPAQGGGLLSGGLFGGGSELGGLACPRVAILEAPSELTRFTEGVSRDISDILFQSKLEINKVTCEVEERAVYVTADSRLSIARGPANIDGKAPFTFFVAVLNGKREIILRQGFPVIVEFKAGEPRVDFEDSVTLEIIKEPEVDAATYTVYAGFEMTAEELQFNRLRQR